MTKHRIEERIKAAQAVMAGESIASGGGRHRLQKNPSSQQIDAKKRTGFGAGRGQGEGRLKFLTLKNLGAID